MKLPIGIMSGRLSSRMGNKLQAFPITSWKNEFKAASSIGYDSIEWIFDNFNNPIFDTEGISDFKNLSKKYNIKVKSICCDYFMEQLLFNVSETNLEKNLESLRILIETCNKLEIDILDIPFVDSSSLKKESDQKEIVINLQKIIPIAEKNNVLLALETDLNPSKFSELLCQFNTHNVCINYDTGNSASLGYDAEQELSILGKWIKNIHIKDRMLYGTSVPLGQGSANFDRFFSTLGKIGYRGHLIIQGARRDELESHEITCTTYFTFVKQYVDKYLE